jgi:hypothetical protein
MMTLAKDFFGFMEGLVRDSVGSLELSVGLPQFASAMTVVIKAPGV